MLDKQVQVQVLGAPRCIDPKSDELDCSRLHLIGLGRAVEVDVLDERPQVLCPESPNAAVIVVLMLGVLGGPALCLGRTC